MEPTPVGQNYGLILSVEELARFCDRLLASGDSSIGFDLETGYLGHDREKYSLHPETAFIVGVSFTDSRHWARYVPMRHDGGENLDPRECARLLWPVLNTGRGVAHGSTFEMRHLARFFREYLADDPEFGAAVRASQGYFPLRSCTQVEAYLAADYQEFGLKFLTEALFGHKMVELHELFPGLPKNRHKFMRFNPLDQHDPAVYEYACEDSAWCLAIHEHYHERVTAMGLYRVEREILQVVCEMEETGVVYDWAFYRRAAEQLRQFRDLFNAEIMEELSRLTGEPVAINLNSPAKVRDVLYTKLGMRTSVYTKSTRDLPRAQRVMSTGKIAIEALAKKYPVVKAIREWKEMQRLLGTYLDVYEKTYSYAADGRAHPHYLNSVVITGRFAAADPPIQGCPRKYHFDLKAAREVHEAHAEAHGPKCTCPEFPAPPGTCFILNYRDGIVAPEDHYILGFDLSQAELRAIAGEAQEPALLEAFRTGQDVHALTAALMLKLPLAEVTADFRDIGKTMNFALMYGMQTKSLADRLAVPVDEATALFNSYFAVFSRIAAWRDAQIATGRAQKYVTSRFGRKLPIWEYHSEKQWVYQAGDRGCVNYPIQGAATGDYVRMAMVRCRFAIRGAGLADKVHLFLNVHDALEFYVHRSVPPERVLAVLVPAVKIPVAGWPAMAADWHIAKRWGSPKRVEYLDGRVLVKGDTVQELVPSVEVDEETGEEELFLDPIDPAVIRAALDRVAAVAERRQLVVELDQMPDDSGYRRFVALLALRPGANALTLRTPEGDLDMTTHAGTDLGPADLAAVSQLLGPARLSYAVDTAAVAAGVRL